MKDRVSEQGFLDVVIEAAALNRWLIHHDRPARTKAGEWRTAVQGHSGFPDLVLAKGTHGVVYLELKSSTGKLTTDQKKWLNELWEAGAHVAVVRPAHMNPIFSLLKKGGTWEKFKHDVGDEKAFGPW